MAGYGAVPNDEHNDAGHMSVQGEHGKTTKTEISYRAGTYTQVPLNEDSVPLKPEHDGSVRGAWMSNLGVHPIRLISLAIFFAASALSIGLLYHFSLANNGLATETNSHRYAWLYGPTAVMVSVHVIWRVIDLKTKAIMPWHELAQGPVPARKSILLEYISSGVVSNLWKSTKNRHWPVTITIIGHLLVLLSTVFVTGLFTLELTTITVEQVPLRSSHFNTSSFDPTKLDASPALLSLAIQTQNLSYPKGTSSDTVVPVFDSDLPQPDGTVTQAIVKGMKVAVNCEVLDIHNASTAYLPWYSIRAPQFLINVTTPSCNMINVRIGEGPNSGGMLNPNSTQMYEGWMKHYACNTRLDTSLPYGMINTPVANSSAWLNATTNRTLDDRIVLAVTAFRNLPQTEAGDIPPMWINSLTALLCKPSYSINRYRVSYSQNTTESNIDFLEATNETLSNFYPGDISKALYQVYNDYPHLWLGLNAESAQYTGNGVQRVAQMLPLLHGGDKANFSLANLTDPNLLKSTTETLLTGTMTQIVHQKLLTKNLDTPDQSFMGTSSFQVERLHVKPLSVGFLCGCFTLLFILCITLLFISPRKPEMFGEVGSILPVAFAIRSNPVLGQLFFNLDSKGLGKQSEYAKFFTRVQPDSGTLGIDFVPVADKVTAQPLQEPEHNDKITSSGEWWRPPTSRGWFVGLTVALCAVIIALLEVIQRLSDKHEGFVNVKDNDFDTAVFSQYIPAAIALAVVWMLSDIERMVATFSSFRTLKRGGGTASQTIALDYYTKSGPDNFFRSIKNRHLALPVILVTTFVTSLLTIVIPGLYSRQIIGVVTNTTLAVADQFKVNNVEISFDDKRAGTIFNLITYYNITYPSWTYNDLAFPEVKISGAEFGPFHGLDQSSVLIRARVAALRPKLTCEPAPGQLTWTQQPNLAYLQTTAYLPWSMCSNPPPFNSTNTTTPWTNLQLSANGTFSSGETHYFGLGGVLVWGQIYSNPVAASSPSQDSESFVNLYNGMYDGEIYPSPYPVRLNQWGCPSMMFLIGSAIFDRKTNSSASNATSVITSSDININALVCRQNLQTVETDITLEYPSMAIAQDSPPQPDESTAKWIENTDDSRNGTDFQFVPTNLWLTLNNPITLDNSSTTSISADRVTQALIYLAQKEGLGVQNIAGRGDSDTYMRILQRLYGQYMAQAISNSMRVPIGGNASVLATTSALWRSTASPVIVPTTISTPTLVQGSPTGILKSVASTAKPPTKSPATQTPTPTNASNRPQKRSESKQQVLSATMTQTGPGAQGRLKQNRGPKIALQVLLSVIIIGAIVAKLLVRTKETLQREPYSIAGRAMLVANGNLLEVINHAGFEQIVFGRRKYRLGWWEDQNGRPRYGIITDM